MVFIIPQNLPDVKQYNVKRAELLFCPYQFADVGKMLIYFRVVVRELLLHPLFAAVLLLRRDNRYRAFSLS